MSTQQQSRTQHQTDDGAYYVIEKTIDNDGTVSERRLDGVKIVSQFTKKQYYPNSAYEGEIYRITSYSDGVEYKSYLKSFDEWFGCYDD